MHRLYPRLLVVLATALLLGACRRSSPTEPPPGPDVAPAAGETLIETPAPTRELDPTAAAGGAQAITGDVVDFSLAPRDDWPSEAKFGWVTFRLHEGRVGGEPVYFIRTDASDLAFTQARGLLWAPLLMNALNAEGATGRIYLFENGVDDQLPVMSTSPANASGYSPLWHVHRVRFTGDPERLDSVAGIEAASAEGRLEVIDQRIVANYPVVRWPGGEMATDATLDAHAGTGQLIALDTDGMSVTFKLHEGFAGARYIVTDASSADWARDMGVPVAPPTDVLGAVGALDAAWAFANGPAGSGIAGHQPAVMGNHAGTPAWSPLSDHFTVEWVDAGAARVLADGAAVRAAVDAGELTLYNGVPDSHPDGFVVNIPVPVAAPNTIAVP